MKKLKLIPKLFVVFVLMSFGNLEAQTAHNAKLILAESKLVVSGTSNVHDWKVDAKAMSGKLSCTHDATILKGISVLDLAVEVASLKSGKNGMDENTVKALKGKTHKTINFKLDKVVKITPGAKGVYTVDTQGSLTVAGTTKKINQKLTFTVSGKKVIISGKYKINMIDYGVEPPKAMLGTIKTGKDVTVDFKVTYN